MCIGCGRNSRVPCGTTCLAQNLTDHDEPWLPFRALAPETIQSGVRRRHTHWRLSCSACRADSRGGWVVTSRGVFQNGSAPSCIFTTLGRLPTSAPRPPRSRVLSGLTQPTETIQPISSTVNATVFILGPFRRKDDHDTKEETGDQDKYGGGRHTYFADRTSAP